MNLRFGGSHVIPTVTRKAMQQVRDATERVAADAGFEVGPHDYLELDYFFGMRNWRSDVDNPMKRVQDAVSDALKFNDNRVVRACARKEVVGEESYFTEFTVTLIPEREVPSPIGYKRPTGAPVWVSADE